MSDLQPHPEVLPSDSAPRDSFLFSFMNVEAASSHNDEQISRFEQRIDKIVREFTVGDMQVIGAVLNCGHDRDELKAVAVGLERVADLVQTLDALKTRKSILQYAKSDPTFFASAFADLEAEINTVLTDDLDLKELNES